MHAAIRGNVPRGHGSIILRSRVRALHRQQVPLALPGGRWHGVLCKGFGPDGKRRRYKVSGRTKQDVIEAPNICRLLLMN